MTQVGLGRFEETGGGGDMLDDIYDYRRQADLYTSATLASDIPASYHALDRAYGDLKKRYNELQTRHQVVLRQIKRSSAPPDLQSPTKNSYLRKITQQEDLTNGDGGSWPSSQDSSQKLESQLFESQVKNSQLKRQIELLEMKLEDSEKECSRLSQQNQSINHFSENQRKCKDLEERYISAENENEVLRKDKVILERKLKDFQQRNTELTRTKGENVEGNSSTDSLSFTTISPDSVPFQTREGDLSMSSDLEPLLHGLVQWQSELLQLKDIVKKQRQVIDLLKCRQQRNLSSDSPGRRSSTLPMPVSTGQGARPKVRSHSTSVLQEEMTKPMQCSDDNTASNTTTGSRLSTDFIDIFEPGRQTLRSSESESALSNMSSATRQGPEGSSTAQQTHLKDYMKPIDSRFLSNVNVSGLNNPNTTPHKRHSAFDIYPQRSSARMAEHTLQSSYRRQSSDSGVIRQLSDTTEDSSRKFSVNASRNEDTDPFENLVTDGTTKVRVDNLFDSEDLPELPNGFYRRNDSLEHLHDDMPHEQDLNDVISDMTSYSDIVSSEFNRQLSKGGEVTVISSSKITLETDCSDSEVKSNIHRLTPDGSLENRYRTQGAMGQQPRPINIERNFDCDSERASPRNLDNTQQNVNLNTSAVGHKYQVDESTKYQVLNNDPLVGHKTIPSRNIYEEADSDQAQRRYPPSGQPSEDRQEPRVCPVCDDDFGFSTPMAYFQDHVSECGVIPRTVESPTDDRVCPMCSEVFPHPVNQRDFETHVNEHFDEEGPDGSANITNQFEVVRFS